MRAIISVSDKTGVIEFAKGLVKLGFEIISTGGTQKILEEAGIPVVGISKFTGFPEILDGRVKTLHPTVYGGILARRNLSDHRSQLLEHNIPTIDLVVVNLYPFIETVAKDTVTLDEAIENIDIGGPSMIRAAAKNFQDVIVVVDKTDYSLVINQLKQGQVESKERMRLAQKAFQHVAVYDTAISQYLRQGSGDFPDNFTVAMKKRYELRYGENPHQRAAFYAEQIVGQRKATGITWADQLWGKKISFNNILDADAAWAAVTDFAAPTIAVIKHTNPCGLSSHENLTEAYHRALSGDPIAAFGGIVASNRPIDSKTAEEIKKTFYEIIIAPGYDDEALKILKQRKDLRILITELPPGYGQAEPTYLDFRKVKGGFLVQTSDSLPENEVNLHIVSDRQPTIAERQDLLFAWRVVKHVKSNAIILIKDKTLLGMGAGQPSRIISAKIAIEKAGEKSTGSILASDAMFPFPDIVEAAAAAGITAIIQPGGSIRDAESIKAAKKYNIAMVFTGIRHFRH